MAETLRSVQEHVDASGGQVDVSHAYEQLWTLVGELHERAAARFPGLERDPSTERFETYGGDGPGGTIRAYAGPEVDWMVHSWLGDLRRSFSNMHLTIWLGPHVRVPHFGLAFGTFPDVWAYMDSVPRADLMVDLDHLDHYYEPVNAEHLDVRSRSGLEQFVSRSLYVRTSLSRTAHCFTTGDLELGVTTVRELAHRHLDRWLRWLDEAEPVPVEERSALAERDLRVRRAVAERDPANNMGVRYFGEEMTEALVRALWGGDRVLPRPDGSLAR